MMMDIDALKEAVTATPAFLYDKNRIEKTLNRLITLREKTGCNILYSIKALPFSPVLRWILPFVDGFSVSSLFEARLAHEIQHECGSSLHLTTPGLRIDEINELARLCTHISYNSANQFTRFTALESKYYSPGIRVNPKLSFTNDVRYDPCRPCSKLGMDIEELAHSHLFDQLEGLHFHNVFAQQDFNPLIITLDALKKKLNHHFGQLQWLNLGGGYLFDENVQLATLQDLLHELNQSFAGEVFMEPGNAIVGPAGQLLTTVIDLFCSDGKNIAVLDTSVNHHPEVFEYQKPPELQEADKNGRYSVLLAGSSCLAGDIFGEYRFERQLQLGDKLTFKRVGAYSLIKANRFNGYNLPSVYGFDGQEIWPLKSFDYADYRKQWITDTESRIKL